MSGGVRGVYMTGDTGRPRDVITTQAVLQSPAATDSIMPRNHS